MNTTAVAVSTLQDHDRAAAEYRDIHLAACRYRRQGLICSTCTEVVERAERLAARVPVEVVHKPVELLVIADDGAVSWNRAA